MQQSIELTLSGCPQLPENRSLISYRTSKGPLRYPPKLSQQYSSTKAQEHPRQVQHKRESSYLKKSVLTLGEECMELPRFVQARGMGEGRMTRSKLEDHRESQQRMSETVHGGIRAEALLQRPRPRSRNMDTAIKKHKADNVREIQQKLRLTVSRGGIRENHKLVQIKDFNRKCGYDQNSKVFVWNSSDQHIRRILLSWGWIHNQATQSPFFHLKWTCMPSFNDSKISDRQYINHFKNSHEISSKSYLTKNLKLAQSAYGKIDEYYPRCYDIGNITQWHQFMQEYQHNVLLVLLKKLYRLCMEKSVVKITQLNAVYKYRYLRIGADLCIEVLEILIRQGIDFKQEQLCEGVDPRDDFRLPIALVVEVLRYWRAFRKKFNEDEDKAYHYLRFDKKSFLKQFPQLQRYSQAKSLCPGPQLKAYLGTPSDLLLDRIVKEYLFCKYSNNLFPSYGEQNIWIVKPTSTSRGSGIFLTRHLDQIHKSSKGIQSRLVQKYIERPLLVSNPAEKQIHMRKFDIRQWVLLRSLDPLEIYMFSQCYLRLCYDTYKVEDTHELHRHLTNYSINKTKFKNKQESVLPLCQFRRILEQEHYCSWDEQLKPKITQIVIKSIKSCIQALDDGNLDCFQLFGFDILIDEELKPWLLEINMSPACEERTQWLAQYLQDMGAGLLSLVLPPDLAQPPADTRYKWELVCLERGSGVKRDAELGLEVVGRACQLRGEAQVDEWQLRNRMAVRIQGFFRECVPKYRRYKQKRVEASECVKRYVRGVMYVRYVRECTRRSKLAIIEGYFQGITCQVKTVCRIKSAKSKKIKEYLTGLLQAHSFVPLRQSHRLKTIQSLSHRVKLRSQLTQFTQFLTFAHRQTLLVQSACRQFLTRCRRHRRLLQTYLLTLSAMSQLPRAQHLHLQSQHTQTLSRYLPCLLAAWELRSRLLRHHGCTLLKYMGSLTCRMEYYSVRVQGFSGLVGRVLRVAVRRRRGECLRGWIRGERGARVVGEYLRGWLQVRRYQDARGGSSRVGRIVKR